LDEDIADYRGVTECDHWLSSHLHFANFVFCRQPKKGSALMFFPAAGGIPNTPFDIRTLHCGESVAKSSDSDKWISQLWLRENTAYKPSAPPGNLHQEADEAVQSYCERAKAA
jgi:hypothetical protein